MSLKETCRHRFWPRKKWSKTIERDSDLESRRSVKYIYKSLLKDGYKARVVFKSEEGLVVRLTVEHDLHPVHILLEPK